MVVGIFVILKILKNFYTNTKIYVKPMTLIILMKKLTKNIWIRMRFQKNLDREDIIGRNDKFKKKIINSFPEYLIKNLNNFKIG